MPEELKKCDIQMFASAKLDFDQPDRVWLLYQGEYVPFRRERTCHSLDSNPHNFECSECGDHWCGFQPNTFHFCPNCGAKVEDAAK